MGLKRIVLLSALILAVSAAGFAQQAEPARPAASSANTGDYRLGAGDLILIRAVNSPELNEKSFRVDLGGFIVGPQIGRIHVAGMTVAALEKDLTAKLGVYLREPDVAVSVTEYQSQPISIFGEVMAPGVHQLQGRKSLVEILSIAGGVKPSAGPSLRITRKLEYGRIPLPGAKDDPTGKFSVAELELKPLVAAQTPEKDIAIEPYDVISVPKAELIYIAGDVTRSGPLSLTDGSSMSVLEALSASGGVTKTANTKKSRILRSVNGNSARTEVPVNISMIMAGKSNDVPLMAGDILVVPSSNTKKAAQRALEAAIQIGSVIVTSGVATGAL